jgi:hypothetical protein
MPDPTMADLIGCHINGYAVTGFCEPYGAIVVGGMIYDTADQAREEAGQWEHVAALIRLEDGSGG